MTERKKKTGDVVLWAIVRGDGGISPAPSREEARIAKQIDERDWPQDGPYRIAKVVLAK